MNETLVGSLSIFNILPGKHLILLPDAPTFTILGATDAYLQATYSQRDELLGKGVLAALREDVANPMVSTVLANLSASLHAVMTSKQPHRMERQRYDLFRTPSGKVIMKVWEPVNQPVLDQDGQVQYIVHTVVDVTEQERARRKMRESEAYTQQLIDEVPAIVWTTEPDGNCSYLNKQWYEYTGQTPAQAQGFGWLDATHPDDRAETGKQFVDANEKRIPFDVMYRLRRHDGVYRWAIDKGSPRFDANGQYLGMIGTVVDVHEQRLAEEALRASEAKLRSVIATAPAAMGLFMGRELVVELPNQTFIDIVGKGPDIEGKPLREVMPELTTENQPFLQILDRVFTTGEMFQSFGSLVYIVQNGVMTANYYNITYTPLRNDAGEVYAILDIAIDVTPEVRARQQLQETEATLRGAIEVAEMGTWEMDMQSGIITYSERLRQLFEFSEDFLEAERLYDLILEADRPRMADALARVVDPESDRMLDEEYTIVTQQTGRQRIVRAQARMYFDEEGNPVKLAGSMRDITEQRQTQWALEQLVQQRTEELATVNEELSTTNEELEEANSLLVRSNENLQTFAYIASHDLQEPLRKIQQFGDMLKTRHGAAMGPGVSYLEKMQSAAGRMSVLIRDLLNFSRISTQRDTSGSVELRAVLEQVLATLELTIEETGAQVDVGPLPTVSGDALQLNQLFQNLLSNALKFRREGVVSRITVRSATVPASALPFAVKPARQADTYYCIEVADNGIGFEEKYIDRIFQVFQRLHNRTEFAGTGIGLSICEKVVTNHGGAITAHSQPDEGATFSVYLPA